MGVNSCGTTLIDEGTFKNIGAVSWDTTAKTVGFTAVSGNGYFVNTTSGAITVTLPSSPTAGDTVGIADYANTADTNNITIGRNGSNIQGVANDFIINTEGGTIILTYVDATKGWLSVDAAQASDIVAPTFITATGGTITNSPCGDYKIHTFTGPGTFTVSSIANAAGGPNNVDYLVIAGGGAGGGGSPQGGGGGAGGYRTSFPSPAGLIPVSVTGYPITVGGGGAGSASTGIGASGSNSVFSTITSTGGGGGGYYPSNPTGQDGNPGGSGGGNGQTNPGAQPTAGTGNTPPVSPPQGNPGGASNNGTSPAAAVNNGTGGGGAGAAGGVALNDQAYAGNGGAGLANSISGSSVTRAGGGGGARHPSTPTGGDGGPGGGGNGGRSPSIAATAGAANTGSGGGGGAAEGGVPTAASGGSGVVIIRYKFQ